MVEKLKEFPYEGSCLSLDEQLLAFLKQNRKFNYENETHNPIGVAWNDEYYWLYKKKTSKEQFDIEELKPTLHLLSVGELVVNIADQVVTIVEIDDYLATCSDGNDYYIRGLIPIKDNIQAHINYFLSNQVKIQELTEANHNILNKIIELYEKSKSTI